MDHRLLDRVLQNDSVPTIPAFALRVVQLCGDPDVNLREVAAVVQNDTATSAKLLRLANSSQYGLSREISSVREAVGLLGLSTVRMVTIATALVGGLDEKDSALDRRSFWRGALITSFAASRLAERSDAEALDQAFLAGLMQNLGVYVMASALGESYGKLLEATAESPLSLPERELAAFGMTHSQVGAQLLRSWNFPEQVADAIECHTDSTLQASDDATLQLAAILHVAEGFRAALLVPGPAQSEEFLRRNRELLGLDEEGAVELMTFVEAHVAEVGEVFDLDLGSAKRLEEARMHATSELMRMVLRTQAQRCRESAETVVDADERRISRFELLGVTVYRADLDRSEALRLRLGDRALQRILGDVSSRLRGALRVTDLVLRWGTTGWMVVVPVGDLPIARRIGERLTHCVRSSEVRTARGEVRVTISVGAISASTCDSEGFPSLVREAERARRAASDAGGDAFQVAEETAALS